MSGEYFPAKRKMSLDSRSGLESLSSVTKLMGQRTTFQIHFGQLFSFFMVNLKSVDS